MHMERTTIMLPRSLKEKVARKARKDGQSLGAFIRQAMTEKLQAGSTRSEDPIFNQTLVYREESPAEGSTRHDEVLYEEA